MDSRTKSFPLRSGTCYIYPDRIEIEQHSLAGKLLHRILRKGSKRVFWNYLALTIIFLVAALVAATLTNYFLVLFFLVAAGFSLVNQFQKRNLSLATLIPKDQIEQVTYAPSVEGERRASFTVYFQPEKRLLRRELLLPGRYQKNGEMVEQSAFYLMRDAGLLQQ